MLHMYLSCGWRSRFPRHLVKQQRQKFSESLHMNFEINDATIETAIYFYPPLPHLW